MVDKDNSLYNMMDDITSKIARGIWPWVSKRRVREKCKNALAEYSRSLPTEGYIEHAKRLKDNELHEYHVVIGYERFPNYYDITQEGEWFIFYANDIIVTARHKDEEIDHTVYYKYMEVKARSEEEAKRKIEYTSKYHICSIVFDELFKGER